MRGHRGYAGGMFVDRALITVKAGHGGRGCIAFRRAKYEPKGGPIGGDGGKGGDVVLYADPGCNTLLDFRGRPNWEAQNGGMGEGKQKTGADAPALEVRVPPGTLVYDNLSGELIVDMAPNQRFTVAKGGNGGFGNEHYKNAVTQAPAHAHPGFPGENKELRLELKLLADVGLIGKPNAGKSTLLAATTRANPKIANYPFTTLAPQLGVAELDPTRRLVIADIPGLIEGASQGAGLGLDFLRHVERTKVLVHVLDVMPEDQSDPAANYKMIRKELHAYSPVLAERDEVIVLNKLDLLPEAERGEAVKRLRAKLKLGREVEVVGLSAAARTGTRDLLEVLWRMLKMVEERWRGVEDEPKANAPAIVHASTGVEDLDEDSEEVVDEPVKVVRRVVKKKVERKKATARGKGERVPKAVKEAVKKARKVGRGDRSFAGAKKASVNRRLSAAAARRTARTKRR